MLSAEYKALSKKDAKVWIKLASDDRARYKKEMLSYVHLHHLLRNLLKLVGALLTLKKIMIPCK